jgi:hypothetical protein
MGAPLCHVERHGLRGISALVLAACLKAPSYDKQLEWSRAKWLFKMFCDDEKFPSFSAAIKGYACKAIISTSETQYLCGIQEIFMRLYLRLF